jgi:nitrate/nitrite transporter NarK
MVGAGALMALVAGWIGDRLNQRTVLLVTFAMISVVSWFVYHGPTSPLPQYLLAF